MRITPEQVKHQEFLVVEAGYDPDDVRKFLSRVAAAYRATIEDLGAQWALQNIDSELADLVGAAHEAAQNGLVAAHDEAEEILANARKEVEGTLDTKSEAAESEARQRVEAIVPDGQRGLEALEEASEGEKTPGQRHSEGLETESDSGQDSA